MSLPAPAQPGETNGHTQPLDPRLRALLIALRQALLIMAKGIEVYCALDR